MLDGGPEGTLVGGPEGTLEGTPVPEDDPEEPGVVGTVEGGDTLAQNCATVSLLAAASAVSCGKLSCALLAAVLVLVPLVAAAQAVHCPYAFELDADPPLPCPLAGLPAFPAPRLAWDEGWPLALPAPRKACDEAWLFGFGTEIPTWVSPPDTADWTGAGNAPAAAAAAPPPSTAVAATAAIAAILRESQFVSIRLFPS
jgi:hypothetical protein